VPVKGPVTYFGLTCHNGLIRAPRGGLRGGPGAAVFPTTHGQNALLWNTSDVPCSL